MIKKILIIILLMVLLIIATGCTNGEQAKEILTNKGYTDIKITGWNPLACSEDDSLSTGYYAKNPSGNYEEGTLCCGLLFKGCTIRN